MIWMMKFHFNPYGKNSSNTNESSQASSLPNDQMSQDNSDLDDEIPF